MKLLQFKNTRDQQFINVKEQKTSTFKNNILNKEDLTQIIGGTTDGGGGEDDDDIVEFMDWEYEG